MENGRREVESFGRKEWGGGSEDGGVEGGLGLDLSGVV